MGSHYQHATNESTKQATEDRDARRAAGVAVLADHPVLACAVASACQLAPCPRRGAVWSAPCLRATHRQTAERQRPACRAWRGAGRRRRFASRRSRPSPLAPPPLRGQPKRCRASLAPALQELCFPLLTRPAPRPRSGVSAERRHSPIPRSSRREEAQFKSGVRQPGRAADQCPPIHRWVGRGLASSPVRDERAQLASADVSAVPAGTWRPRTGTPSAETPRYSPSPCRAIRKRLSLRVLAFPPVKARGSQSRAV
jgi:hypothetical protein